MRKSKGQPQPFHRSKISNIELLNKYNEVKNLAHAAGLSPDFVKSFRREVTDKIGQDESAIEKRLAGLDAENEFMLMALMLGNLEQITPLRQRQPLNWETYGVPDFLLAVLVPKQFAKDQQQMIQRFFVEVKKAKEGESEVVIPVEILDKLKGFSSLYGIPLYFGIKIKSLGLSQWFLLSDRSMEKLGKRIKGKVRGKEEDCISAPILSILKEDSSGLLLSNYYVLIPKGFRICKKYRQHCDSVAINPNFGKLAEVEVSNAGKRIIIVLKEGVSMEELLTHFVAENLSIGEKRIEKVEGGVNVVHEAHVNYWVPFYHVVLQSYLDLRERYEPIIMDNPNPKPNAGYFLQVFSEFDLSISAGLRQAIFNMEKEELILPVRMLPETMFDGTDAL